MTAVSGDAIPIGQHLSLLPSQISDHHTSISRSASLSVTPVDPLKALEECHRTSIRRMKMLEEDSESHYKHSSQRLTQILGQLDQLDAKRLEMRSSARRTETVGAVVLAYEEVRQELEKPDEAETKFVKATMLGIKELRQKSDQLCEMIQMEQRQPEEAVWKAGVNAIRLRRQRGADKKRIFSGRLSKSKRREELVDIAVALALPEGGKKAELFQRISDHFELHPDFKANPRFEGLFHSRPLKRARC